MADTTLPLHLGVSLGGTGTHPRAWKLVPDQSRGAFTARYYLRLAALAQEAKLDFLYFGDAYALQSSDDRDFRGRLDAVLLASRLGPATEGIGLVPAFTVTHAEPFHVSKAVATLDFASLGRAGWSIRTAGADDPYAEEQSEHFGRRAVPTTEQAYAEAADVAEVVKRLFDSWEDDAEIRDLATGRFIDRDKLHYVDFAGDFFSVKGPSITPRPPQGQPVTVVPVDTSAAVPVAARYAEVAIISATDRAAAAELVRQVQQAAVEAGRATELTVLLELDVLLARSAEQLTELRAVLDADSGRLPASRGVEFQGTPEELVEVLADLGPGFGGALVDFAALPSGLELFTSLVVPRLQERGLFRTEYAEATLRERFGLDRPTNVYAA